MRIGWHGFLMYGKAKIYGQFKQHILRKTLIGVWEQLKYKIYRKLPNWIKSLEIINNPGWLDRDQNPELLDKKGEFIKEIERLKRGIKLNW